MYTNVVNSYTFEGDLYKCVVDFYTLVSWNFLKLPNILNFHLVENLSCRHQAAEMLEKNVCNLTDQFASFKTPRQRNA